MKLTKSFASFVEQRKETPSFHAEELAVTFLAELNQAMRDGNISNAELARRVGVSPAYITKVFRGPSNLSVETLAKLAIAVGARARLSLRRRHAAVKWQDVLVDERKAVRGWAADFGAPVELVAGNAMDLVNDEKFALAA